MGNLYNQFNDLYQLQVAARELEHGVKDQTWKLFEPSKFVYAFFAFNSFYSIDWEETQKQQQLIKWELFSNSGEENDKPKTESQKISEMRKYIYYSYVKQNGSKEEQYAAKEVIANQFVLRLNIFIDDDLTNIKEIMMNIVSDNIINDKMKNSFLEAFDNLTEKRLLGKRFNDAFDTVLKFVFYVRNNIFHGSKTVIEMMESGQRERFKVYTAILLAVNEMLFDVIEKNFDWERNEIDSNLERKQKLKENQIIKRFLDNTVTSKFNIEVPEGVLFYPCCGDDTYEPLRLFLNTITEFHFVDSAFLPNLPLIECGVVGGNDPIRKWRSRPNLHLIPKAIIETAQSTNIEERVNNQILEELKVLNIKPTGFYNNNTLTYKQEWQYKPEKNRKINVYRHVQDGLVTFMQLDKIAVFLLRGDSEGEGGSGQRWFQDSILELILKKLVDGGLIVTDGSSLDPRFFEDAPWKPLWKNRNARKSDNPKNPEDFYYNDRKFTCIGQCGYKYGPVYIWKVTKHNYD